MDSTLILSGNSKTKKGTEIHDSVYLGFTLLLLLLLSSSSSSSLYAGYLYLYSWDKLCP